MGFFDRPFETGRFLPSGIQSLGFDFELTCKGGNPGCRAVAGHALEAVGVAARARQIALAERPLDIAQKPCRFPGNHLQHLVINLVPDRAAQLVQGSFIEKRNRFRIALVARGLGHLGRVCRRVLGRPGCRDVSKVVQESLQGIGRGGVKLLMTAAAGGVIDTSTPERKS